jgi:hypothetical protein
MNQRELNQRELNQRELNRRELLRSASLAALWSLAPGIVFAQGAAGSVGLWHQRPLRIYHSNPRESELRTLDVKRFVAGCAQTRAEAVVISVGGVYAFYRSQVKYHYVSQVIGDRDLVGEIATECGRQNLRVIARVDFAKAREEVWGDHPEWFRRDPKGAPVKRDNYYAACPLGGYQNAEFAYPVLREILSRYPVDGFHLNAGGFDGYCYCANCAGGYAGKLPTDPVADPAAWRQFLRWRREVISRQMAGYYRVMREVNPQSFFMAELWGEERPQSALSSGYHPPSLVQHDSFSQLLFTSAEMRTARDSRLWVGLTADHAYAAGGRPLINIKMQMRDLRLSQTFMPPAEFTRCAMQALAHGAGLKLVTLAIPERVLDARTLPRAREVFAFMQQQAEVFDSMVPLASTALVWPEGALLEGSALEGKTAEALRAEALGLYTGLKQLHVPLRLIYDEQIAPERLRGLETVVLATAAWLTDVQAQALAAWVRGGGRLLLFDSPAADAAGLRPLPSALTGLLGGSFTQTSMRARYIALDLPLAAQGAPAPLRGFGPLPLTLPFRQVTAAASAQVWYRAAHSDDAAAPEDIEDLRIADDPIILLATAEKGSVFYIATGWGQMIERMGHADYVTVLAAMLRQGVAKPPLMTTDAPGTVDVTLATWKDGQVVQLVNNTGPAPLDAVVPLGAIEMNVAWRGPARVELMVPGATAESLPAQAEGGRLRFTVPRLDAFAQVVIHAA